MKLYGQLVKDGIRQLTYYNSGIGTFASPSRKSLPHLKQVLENKIDLAVAWWVLKYFVVFSSFISHCRTFERIVISAYRWLAENYIPGDRIFLFGKHVLAIMSIMSINWIPIRVFSRCLSSPRSCRHDREGGFEPNFVFVIRIKPFSGGTNPQRERGSNFVVSFHALSCFVTICNAPIKRLGNIFKPQKSWTGVSECFRFSQGETTSFFFFRAIETIHYRFTGSNIRWVRATRDSIQEVFFENYSDPFRRCSVCDRIFSKYHFLLPVTSGIQFLLLDLSEAGLFLEPMILTTYAFSVTHLPLTNDVSNFFPNTHAEESVYQVRVPIPNEGFGLWKPAQRTGEDNKLDPKDDAIPPSQRVKEIWFAGTHSDMYVCFPAYFRQSSLIRCLQRW